MGADDIAPFSGSGENKTFSKLFRKEMKKFICGDSAYAAERDKLLAEYKGQADNIVLGIAVAIASAIGSSSAMLAAPVALMLSVIARASIAAWCKMDSE